MSSATSVRPAYRPYRLRVSEVRRLSPHFVRVSFAGGDLVHFGRAGLDQRIKVIVPFADGSMGDFGQDDPAVADDGSWYARWRELPAEARNPLRTYTVRRIDPEAARLDVDFVTHHTPGPAGAWVAGARPGDELVIVGPDERSPQSRAGLDWHPGSARRVLLVGDETAAPAIASILESLDHRAEVDAFIEVPTAADVLPLDCAERFRVRWIARDDAEHGVRLTAALGEWCDGSRAVLATAGAPRPQDIAEMDVDSELIWDSPEEGEGEFYAWIAGEAGVVKTLRRLLVTTHGVDRKRVAFMGYWRIGRSERQE